MIAPLKAGEIIDERYQIRSRLGRGAAALVYAARDRTGEREVAIKVMSRRIADRPDARARFEREAVVQRSLRHPNVAALYGSGMLRTGEPYLVLELLRGRSLRDVVAREAPIPAARAADYALQALAGLATVHSDGVLHRDLKPANLMLEPVPDAGERVVLIDFGFASLEGGARLTATGKVVGSLGYIAPERLTGDGASPRSDLYALGTILFELLTGRRPFRATNQLALIDLQLRAPVPAIDELAPDSDVPAALEAVIRRALEKDPELRFDSAREMAGALASAAES